MKNLFVVIFFSINIFCNNNTKNSEIEKKEKIIGIQTFGIFDKSLIDTIKITIEDIYGHRVLVLPKMSLPKSAFINVKSPRYRGDTLLRILRRNKPDSINYVLGLTEKDISTTKRDKYGNIKKPKYKYSDWGIFGLGYCPGPSCIVSTYRIKSSDKTKFIERFKKVCIHELGHNMGLRHCKAHDKCVMRDADETIKTVDNENLALCKTCKNLIK